MNEEETSDCETESSIDAEKETETPVRLLCGYHRGDAIAFCSIVRVYNNLSVARFSNITHSLPLPSIFPPIGSIFGKSDAAEAEEVGEKIATDCDIEVRFVLRLLL